MFNMPAHFSYCLRGALRILNPQHLQPTWHQVKHVPMLEEAIRLKNKVILCHCPISECSHFHLGTLLLPPPPSPSQDVVDFILGPWPGPGSTISRCLQIWWYLRFSCWCINSHHHAAEMGDSWLSLSLQVLKCMVMEGAGYCVSAGWKRVWGYLALDLAS